MDAAVVYHRPMQDVTGSIREATFFARERDRWVTWTPVFLGLGIAVYFALPVEPPGWSAAGAVLAMAAVAALLRQSRAALFGLAGLIVALGFAAAVWRSAQVAAPVLRHEMGPLTLQGRLTALDERGPGVYRLTLAAPVVAGLAAKDTPARLRITRRRAAGPPMVAPGDVVSLRARLWPPPEPAAPGAYDFARQAWFKQLGGLGVALGPVRRLAPAGERGLSFGERLARLRLSLARRIRAATPGEAGAVAAALMTGRRGEISPPTLQALRDAGLGHLLAISGLHVGLLSGVVFFAVRALLALWPAVALRRAIKKWAALAALLAALAYLLISGMTIPTQRAFVMTGVVLVAVMLDRVAISMRLVAIAASILLLVRPESLLSVSFQMSFAAVAALVALYERSPGDEGLLWLQEGREAGRGRRLARYFALVALTSLVAGAATAPFAVFHFNRLAHYGVLANLVAIPLMAFWIMPWAIIAFALMPLGLEGWALAPMAWGIDTLLAAARAVAGWPGAVGLMPAMPPAALWLMVLGGLWLTLWRQRWRFFGLLPMLAGVALYGAARPPDILIDGQARLVGLRLADGDLALSSGRGGRILRETWLRRAGKAASAAWPANTPQLSCDGLGCIYRRPVSAAPARIALIFDVAAVEEDCARADMIISLIPLPRTCTRAKPTIDRFDLWRGGSYAVWLGRTIWLGAKGERGGSGVDIRSVSQWRGARPWNARADRQRTARVRPGRP
jgi:competence protein ComEC